VAAVSIAPLGDLERRSIAASVALHDFVRRAPPFLRKGRGHREWLHFFVSAPGLELFVNVSVFDDLRPAAGGTERVRVLVLTRTADGAWDGDVDEIDGDDVILRGGQLNGSFGRTRLEHIDGAIHLRGALRSRPIAFDLVFEPRSYPSLATDVKVGERGRIHWMVVPQLSVRGSVTAGKVQHELVDAPAYHDHNWGVFAHNDFRWQWGHAQDLARGQAVVLARLLDGVAGKAFLQSLFVWNGPRIARIFRGDELSFRPDGFLKKRSLTLPRLAALLSRGATEVPQRLLVEARGGGDALSGELVFEDAACLVLGEGADLESTLLYEVIGRLRLVGRVMDETIDLDAPVVFETMRKA